MEAAASSVQENNLHGKLTLIHGPNLNLLGKRETEIYGKETLAEITTKLRLHIRAHGFSLLAYQSNSEGALIDFIQTLQQETSLKGMIINLGAYTHTSIAIHDALRMIKAPIIEVHLSNTAKREAFRHHSYLASLGEGTIQGLGSHGYFAAADYLLAKASR